MNFSFFYFVYNSYHKQRFVDIDKSIANHVPAVSPDFIERHKLRIKDAFATIELMVRTSPLNIAMVGTLSHGEYFISDPLRNELTLKHHSTPEQAVQCMGTFAMACIVQAGHAYYNTTLVNDLPPLSKHAGRKAKKEKPSATAQEGSDDDDQEPSQLCENDIDSLISNLPNFATQGRLPQIEDINAFLKKAFTSLDINDHYFLQSILPDIYVLQPWTRPMDNEEDKTLRSLLNQRQQKTVDLTTGNEEDDLFGGLNIDALKFDGLKSVKGKHPVNPKNSKKKAQRRQDENEENDSEEMDTEVTSDTHSTPASSTIRSGNNDKSSNSKKHSASSEKRMTNESGEPRENAVRTIEDNGMYLR